MIMATGVCGIRVVCSKQKMAHPIHTYTIGAVIRRWTGGYMIVLNKVKRSDITIDEREIIIKSLYKQTMELINDYDYNFSTQKDSKNSRLKKLENLTSGLITIERRIGELENEGRY